MATLENDWLSWLYMENIYTPGQNIKYSYQVVLPMFLVNFTRFCKTNVQFLSGTLWELFHLNAYYYIERLRMNNQKKAFLRHTKTLTSGNSVFPHSSTHVGQAAACSLLQRVIIRCLVCEVWGRCPTWGTCWKNVEGWDQLSDTEQL